MAEIISHRTILPLLLTIGVLKTAGGSNVGKVKCGRQLMALRGRRDDIDEMVSYKCIHKKINHYLLTLLLLQIEVVCAISLSNCK
jgi:hypothetical protein